MLGLEFNESLLWIAVKVLAVLCGAVALLTVADAVLEWWEGPK